MKKNKIAEQPKVLRSRAQVLERMKELCSKNIQSSIHSTPSYIEEPITW